MKPIPKTTAHDRICPTISLIVSTGDMYFSIKINPIKSA
jgi:hypothetical protein